MHAVFDYGIRWMHLTTDDMYTPTRMQRELPYGLRRLAQLLERPIPQLDYLCVHGLALSLLVLELLQRLAPVRL